LSRAKISGRIARGPIPSHEAIPIACQIADALEAAHEQAIVHRDLKPANVKVREDGTVKVLDFGLAKSMEPAGSSPGAPESTTQTTPLMTEVGTILGTAAYMSPEQARGKTVGKAADVWAFGCVLYEMLTGRRTFTGATSTDVLAAILEREPDWTALPVSTPPHVTRLLRRCLEKGLKHRLHDIADARIELERPHAEVELAGTLAGRSSRRSRFLASAAVLAVGAGIGALTSALMFRTPSATPALSQFVETVSDGKTLPSATFGTGSLIALSPDGRTVVYLAREKGQERLFARSLNRLDGLNSASIGEPAARDPFFSPDGAWLG